MPNSAIAFQQPIARVIDTNGTHQPPELQREGDFWRIGIGPRPAFVAHCRGMEYLVQLSAVAGMDVHVLELTRLANASPIGPAAGHREPQLHLLFSSDFGEHIDSRARSAYERRQIELDRELAAALRERDEQRATHVRRESRFLLQELSRALSRTGRLRRAGSDIERARINVTRSLRATVTRIGEQCSELGDHYNLALRTGIYCSYAPGRPPRLR